MHVDLTDVGGRDVADGGEVRVVPAEKGCSHHDNRTFIARRSQ